MCSSFIGKTCEHFGKISDPRVNRGRNFPLAEMIFLALAAAISGADTWVDVERFGKSKTDWLRKYLPFGQGIPSHNTLGRVFSRLDTTEFYAALQSFTGEIVGAIKGQTVAFDGKTLCGSFDASTGKSALHSVSAWVCGLRMCIGLKSVEDKSNEIPAVQELIDLLDLAGSVVTADAMHCQKETARAVIEKEADYVLIAKGNQPTLHAAIQESLVAAMEADDPAMRKARTVEKSHGRKETREVIVLPVLKDCDAFGEWEGIKSIGAIHRTRQIDDQLQEETEYFITSLPPKPRAIGKHLRLHWSIENQQHHILDVTFSEDASRIRKGNGPEISSVFRRLTLSILQQDSCIKDNIRGKRKRCGWDTSLVDRILSNLQTN